MPESAPARPAATIALSELSKTFGAERAVDGLSFTVESGEVFGFLGPNGAGKTTTIRMLMGFLRPSGGKSTILGFDVWRDRVRVHERVGNLPGDFTFEPSLTGRRLVRLLSRLRGVDGEAGAERVAKRLAADLDRSIGTLSRGNRQKIGLVQALAHDPELLILDEPTSGLDPLMQDEFLTIVGELRERGVTVMLSSHNLAEVERICDRVAMIRKGRLVALERVDALRGMHVHDVRLVLEREPDRARFERLPATDVVRVTGNTVELTVGAGDLDAVMGIAAESGIEDMTCEPPSLEREFVHLYRDESDRDGEPTR